MKRNIIIFLMLIGLPLAGCSAIADLSSNAVQSNQWYSVYDFVDGDTFKIKTGDDITTIRLLYVDTPETKKPNSPVEPFGPEASAYTEQLLNESKKVRLTFDKELTDKYERTLAIVELKDGRILNELLLEQGLAKVLIVEPNVKMENVYKQIEQQAKQNKQGIWRNASDSDNTDIPVKKAARSGIVIEVDKRAELVTITNTTNESITMDGWKLVSVRGNQTYPFGPYELAPKQKVLISSAEESEAPVTNALEWGASNIWNNSESDPAELYNANNELVAVWEDE
ncbi:thermonuclease family protein [Paenibacillus alkaliterrae]|uniref:thermonuclease family protein n=1 Tax=Paenibacillus alkaliterrae TaxID=320909 RepID=UPI001F455BFC|nr:thermonuclease family protein [Paenibacillus alkaliterrae]MCF2936889.1 thermonuclease family protein [Paenibacillus alkaliterrae]